MGHCTTEFRKRQCKRSENRLWSFLLTYKPLYWSRCKELEWWINNVHARPQSVLYTQYWILIVYRRLGPPIYLSQGMILLYTAIDSGITCLETFAAELATAVAYTYPHHQSASVYLAMVFCKAWLTAAHLPGCLNTEANFMSMILYK